MHNIEVLVYANGLIWKHSYHSQGARIGIIVILSTTRQVHAEVVCIFFFFFGNASVIMYEITVNSGIKRTLLLSTHYLLSACSLPLLTNIL